MAVSKTRSNYPKLFSENEPFENFTTSVAPWGTTVCAGSMHVCVSTKDLIGALVVLIERAGEKTTLFHFKFYVTV